MKRRIFVYSRNKIAFGDINKIYQLNIIRRIFVFRLIKAILIKLNKEI